jgi:starvation-inducible DNA-binding protein
METTTQAWSGPGTEATRKTLVENLNEAALTLRNVQLAVKVAHWNVRGPNFVELHELFDQLYGHLEGGVDLLAERAVQLGGVALGTAQEVAGVAPADATAQLPDGSACVAWVAERAARASARLYQGIAEAEDAGDPVTADILTGLARQIDKDFWWVRAHLDGADPRSAR